MASRRRPATSTFSAHAPDAHAVSAVLLERHGHESRFFIRQWTTADRPVIAGFVAHGWAFEVFASPASVEIQPGWLHFTVERRLLELGGDALRDAVMLLRRQGLKTEPAFAEVLGLVRDPYAAMLSLAREGDGRLKAMLVAAGFKTRDH